MLERYYLSEILDTKAISYTAENRALSPIYDPSCYGGCYLEPPRWKQEHTSPRAVLRVLAISLTTELISDTSTVKARACAIESDALRNHHLSHYKDAI
jgi:hypothetical protein